MYCRFRSNGILPWLCFPCGPVPGYIKPIREAFKSTMNGSASNFLVLGFPSAEVKLEEDVLRQTRAQRQ
jgi:hypothetical protein